MMPYLPHIEAFDVSAAYFASIETGAGLFVRRRDRGDTEPVIAGRPVPAGAAVFVDNRYVYVRNAESGDVDQLDVETLTSARTSNVTDVWSIDEVVLQRGYSRCVDRGSVELALDPDVPLAVAFSNLIYAVWTSVGDLPVLDGLSAPSSDVDVLGNSCW
jgi:hypothetical protein